MLIFIRQRFEFAGQDIFLEMNGVSVYALQDIASVGRIPTESDGVDAIRRHGEAAVLDYWQMKVSNRPG
jgi:hypothetical protein